MKKPVTHAVTLSEFERRTLDKLLGYMVYDRILLAQQLLNYATANPCPFTNHETAALGRIWDRVHDRRGDITIDSLTALEAGK